MMAICTRYVCVCLRYSVKAGTKSLFQIESLKEVTTFSPEINGYVGIFRKSFYTSVEQDKFTQQQCRIE